MATPFIIVLAVFLAAVLIAEALLWLVFRLKATPISFTHETDASSLRFFTFNRLRFLVLAHTCLLIGVTFLLFFWLW